MRGRDRGPGPGETSNFHDECPVSANMQHAAPAHLVRRPTRSRAIDSEDDAQPVVNSFHTRSLAGGLTRKRIQVVDIPHMSGWGVSSASWPGVLYKNRTCVGESCSGSCDAFPSAISGNISISAEEMVKYVAHNGTL